MLQIFKKTKGRITGISFVDSTKIKVCENIRAKKNKVFKISKASHEKTSIGWFFGFKLHLIINHKSEIISFKISKGNKDDRCGLEEILPENIGDLYGDKGYLGKSFAQRLFNKGCNLYTNVKKKNMKAKLKSLWHKSMLKKRFIIETVFGIFKEDYDLEHTRYRNVTGFIVNILSSLISYNLKKDKPKLNINEFENNDYQLNNYKSIS